LKIGFHAILRYFQATLNDCEMKYRYLVIPLILWLILKYFGINHAIDVLQQRNEHISRHAP